MPLRSLVRTDVSMCAQLVSCCGDLRYNRVNRLGAATTNLLKYEININFN